MVNKTSNIIAAILRHISIVLMSLTAAFTLLSGIGTSCVALAAENFGAMAVLAPYQWLYITFVVVTSAIGILGVRAVVLLIRGRANGYRSALIALVLGLVVGGVHMLVSRSLRGSSMPVDAVVYTTALTLLVFLIYRIPWIRDDINILNKDESQSRISGGMSAIVVSAFILSIHYWMAPTHTIQGVNYASAFETGMLVSGLGTAVVGISCLVWEACATTPGKKARFAQQK